MSEDSRWSLEKHDLDPGYEVFRADSLSVVFEGTLQECIDSALKRSKEHWAVNFCVRNLNTDNVEYLINQELVYKQLGPREEFFLNHARDMIDGFE